MLGARLRVCASTIITYGDHAGPRFPRRIKPNLSGNQLKRGTAMKFRHAYIPIVLSVIVSSPAVSAPAPVCPSPAAIQAAAVSSSIPHASPRRPGYITAQSNCGPCVDQCFKDFKCGVVLLCESNESCLKGAQACINNCRK